eukprot:45001_1
MTQLNCTISEVNRCSYGTNLNETESFLSGSYCCVYLSSSHSSQQISQNELHEFITLVRDMNIASFACDFFFVIIAFITFVSLYFLKGIETAKCTTLLITSLGSLIDIIITFTVVIVVEQNNLIQTMLDLYDNKCYSEDTDVTILDLQNQFQNILILDMVEGVLDLISLLILIAGYCFCRDSTLEAMSEGIHGFMFAVFDLILITVNVFIFVLPSYQLFTSFYDNELHLCYTTTPDYNFMKTSSSNVYKWILISIVLGLVLFLFLAWCGHKLMESIKKKSYSAASTGVVAGNIPLESTHRDRFQKMLLLGIGGSGKTTIFKQLSILSGSYERDRYHSSFKQAIFNQVVDQMRTSVELYTEFVEERPDLFPVPLSNDATIAKTFLETYSRERPIQLNDQLVGAIKCLWREPGMKEMFANRAEYRLEDSNKYFWDDMNRLAKSYYVPTVDDVMMVYRRTCGMTEIKCKLFSDGYKYMIYDQDGQRCGRKRWIHSFENVSVVMFLVELSGYDRVLYEDENENNMVETIKCWNEVCNSAYFENSLLILLLNKSDLFRDKIQQIPICVCPSFEHYSGESTDFDQAIEYIKGHFKDCIKDKDKSIEIYEISAINANDVKTVFEKIELAIASWYLDYSLK